MTIYKYSISTGLQDYQQTGVFICLKIGNVII